MMKIAGVLVPTFLVFALVFWHLSNVACDSYAATARPGTVMEDCFTGSVLLSLLLMVLMILLSIAAMAVAIGAFFWNRNRTSSPASFIDLG